MSNIIHFHSIMAEQLRQFVALKRMQGYDYTDQARNLSYFDKFLADQHEGDQGLLLTLDVLEKYVSTTSHLEGFSRRTRLSSLRQFSRYLHARSPGSVLLREDIVPRHPPKVRFCRIEPWQTADLMSAVLQLAFRSPIRAPGICTLIGLLYSTGLRIDEALQLTLGDINSHSSVLYVAKGKFSKQRLVPMSASTLSAVTEYLSFRNRHADTAEASPLFIAAYNKGLSYCQAYDGFQRACCHCGLTGDPRPRLHDLRHNYACRRLALWRQEGRDVNAMLPVLAAAMGHVDIFRTQIYLHIEPSELHDASDRLDAYLNTHRECEQ